MIKWTCDYINCLLSFITLNNSFIGLTANKLYINQYKKTCYHVNSKVPKIPSNADNCHSTIYSHMCGSYLVKNLGCCNWFHFSSFLMQAILYPGHDWWIILQLWHSIFPPSIPESSIIMCDHSIKLQNGSILGSHS